MSIKNIKLIFCPVIDSTNGAAKQTIVEVGDNVTTDDDGTIERGDIGELVDQYDTVFEVLLLSRHYAVALQVKTLLWMVTSIQHSTDRT